MLVATKYWRWQKHRLRQNNIGAYKTLAPPKCWRRQNNCVDKIIALTKYSCRQKSRVDKNLTSRKCWRMRGSISLLFGPAESTAADLSQTSLMFSYVSQKVLIPPHAVAKCAFYGRTLSCTVPAYCTGPPCWKCHKYWRQQNIGTQQDFTDFCQTVAANISAHRRPTKNLWKQKLITIIVKYQFTYS